MLAAVAQVRIVVVVVQVHAVRAVATVLCRIPDERAAALEVVPLIVVPVAGRQRRERVIISAVATTVPPTCRFEHFSRCTGTTYRWE